MNTAIQMVPVENLDFERAWTAVQARDGRADGRFVYAVNSTGIYCKPSCPSRRPERKQVTFFATTSGAEAAGYRACLRCRPNSTEPPPAIDAVRRARNYLEAHFDEPVTLAQLGQRVGMSPFHLQRTFKRVTGLTPREYIGARRAERLKARLRSGDDVTTAVFEAGYASSSRAYEASQARLGMTPSDYRQGGRGRLIRYTTVDTPLGRLLVAATDRGLCAVLLGTNDQALEANLRREYPNAQLQRGGQQLQQWVQAIAGQMEGSSASLALPLDVQASVFQWKVWKALQAIPRGATRSYSEIAAAVGQPNAARAVAQACAQNRLALVIPCHRVVRADGKLGGYRWGVQRKRRLLEAEQGPPTGSEE